MSRTRPARACPNCGFETRSFWRGLCFGCCRWLLRYGTMRPANWRGNWSLRFWAKVDKDGPGDCWLWTGSTYLGGYGHFGLPGVGTRGAHRIAYELLIGPIPEGLQLDHLCCVPQCVNPAHLEPVTAGENVRRGIGFAAANARKTHCPRGHPYTPENTRMSRRGQRFCRTCDRQRSHHGREPGSPAAARSFRRQGMRLEAVTL